MTEDWNKDLDDENDNSPEKSMSSVVAAESLEQVDGDEDSESADTDES